MQMPAFEKHVWAEIDLDALRHNFRAVKARAGEMPLCAVVKADSYGHGAVECAKVFAEEGAAWLAVSCLAEARQLRKAGLTLPILPDPKGVIAKAWGIVVYPSTLLIDTTGTPRQIVTGALPVRSSSWLQSVLLTCTKV